MKLKKIALLSAFAAMLLTLGLQAAEYTLEIGKRPLMIFRGQPLTEGIRIGAGELAEHLKLAIGLDVQITDDESAIPDGAFVFRLLNAPADSGLGFYQAEWNCDENSLTIAGNNERDSQGTMFAVYDWLDRCLGCRWLWPGDMGRIVPATQTITFQTGNGIYKPTLRSAFWRPCADQKSKWHTEEGWVKFFSYQQQWFFRNRIANDMALQNYPHGFEDWWGRFGKTHPEYFQMLPDGTRRPDPTYVNGAPTLISMCVSNPDVIRQTVQDWLDDYDVRWPQINLNENDTSGRCTCDNCMAWDDSPISTEVRREKALRRFKAGDEGWVKALGSVTNRYAKFYLAVLEEADRVAPERHAEIAGLIYANYSDAPDFKMSDRIFQRYCPPIMFPWTEAKLNYYREQWQKWADTGCLMMMRPNFTLDGHCYPINYASEFSECFRFGLERNMFGIDMDSCTGNFSTTGTTMYMIARLLNRPELSDDEIIAEYCSAFGNAADEIREYFDYLAQLSRRFGTDPALLQNAAIVGGDYGRFHMIASLVFTDEVLADLSARLGHAIQTAGDDEMAVKRLQWMMTGIEHCKLVNKMEAANVQYNNDGNLLPFAAALKQLDEFRDEHEQEFLANVGFLRFLEGLYLPIEKARLAAQDGLKPLPIFWNFCLDPDKSGETDKWFAPDFDDSSWQKLSTDKCWEDQLGQPYDGYGWYRLAIDLPADFNGDPILVMGAVDEACDIWINGKLILHRPFPYKGNNNSWAEAFEVPFKKVAKPGRNIIAVRVSDDSGAGGIWQPCFLKNVK